MKVLIADFDLFKNLGGGQTFYRNLIKKHPNIYFYYFRASEPSDFPRPENAIPIIYRVKYALKTKRFYSFTPPPWIYHVFTVASNMAASVAGSSFDVVDLPDYEQYGTLMEPALKHHNVDFKKIVLSMHGRISKSIRLNWSTEGISNLPLNLQEEMQYSAVDIRYGISKNYLDEWHKIIDLESHYLDPLSYFPRPKAQTLYHSNDIPSINFIGRKEKCKGPDIFVELAWWLPKSSFSSASLIGPDSYDNNGISSAVYLERMIKYRLRNITLEPAISYTQLVKLFSTKTVTFLPSRADTFNLIALESLFSGCPTVIGSGAGIIRFLKETFPQIPFITIDVNNIYSCIPEIGSVLENYNEYRQHLLDIILSLEKLETRGLDIESIYYSNSVYDSVTRVELANWYSQLISLNESLSIDDKVISFVLKVKDSSLSLKRSLKNIKSVSRNINKIVINKAINFLENSYNISLIKQEIKVLSQKDKYNHIFSLEENTEKSIREKLKTIREITFDCRIDRVSIWREIARLERLVGNEVVAATYQLRAMRLLGHDRFGDIAAVVSTLENKGFGKVALVAEAMYGKSSEKDERCTEILEQALKDNQLNQKWDYEFTDDRRELATYRASVIVSLYKAADKLPRFLQALQNQTMIKAGMAEIILIDSGSPDDEYQAFRQCMTNLNIPIIYARSSERETIQSAWNRGIALSRSPYLAFLGADETILPDCLEVLAAELDADSSLDWVLGSSLVTNVDRHCNWVNDIMLYDREGYRQDMVYLDTCYLSYVGALYRRSIHDRFGYYDTSFTAAGDTEFKLRVLPFIKSKSIPRTLGIFWNYPDERTTQHPRAEIEDLRAWYLHRTPAGVKYAFSRRDPRELEKLFYDCLRYRKSYCKHCSTDIEYAYNLSTLLQEKFSHSTSIKYIEGVNGLLDVYRDLELIKNPSELALLTELIRVNTVVKKLEQQHISISNQVEPIYQIFNDNRYEQHSNLW